MTTLEDPETIELVTVSVPTHDKAGIDALGLLGVTFANTDVAEFSKATFPPEYSEVEDSFPIKIVGRFAASTVTVRVHYEDLGYIEIRSEKHTQ